MSGADRAGMSGVPRRGARTPAERQRQHRARVRAGEPFQHGTVPRWLVEEMARAGLYPNDDGDPETVWRAVVDYIRTTGKICHAVTPKRLKIS